MARSGMGRGRPNSAPSPTTITNSSHGSGAHRQASTVIYEASEVAKRQERLKALRAWLQGSGPREIIDAIELLASLDPEIFGDVPEHAGLVRVALGHGRSAEALIRLARLLDITSGHLYYLEHAIDAPDRVGLAP